MRKILLIIIIAQAVNISFAIGSTVKDTSKSHKADYSYSDKKFDDIQNKIDNNQREANNNIASAKQDMKDIIYVYVGCFIILFGLVGFAINFFGRKAIKARVEEIIAQTAKDHVDTAIVNLLNSKVTTEFISELIKEKGEKELYDLLKTIESKGENTINQFKAKGNEVLNSMIAAPQKSADTVVSDGATDEEINEANINNRANEYFNLAYAAVDSRIAVELYKNVIELQPDNVAAYNNIGVAFNNIDKYEEAIKMLNKAIEIDPNFDIAYSNRAHAYNQLDDLTKASADIETAIKMNPKIDAAYATKGNILTKQNKFIEAEESLNTAIELNPNSPFALFNRGYFYEERHQYAKSETDYIEAEKNGFPNKAWLYNNMAVLYRRQKRYKEAIEFIGKAREQNPDFSNLDGTLALIYADQGMDDEFYKYITSALGKGCRVWNYLSDPGFDKYKNSQKLKTLIETYKKVY